MRGGWLGVGDHQFPTFDAETKSAKIPKSFYSWRGAGDDNQFPTFDAESKSAKIPKSPYDAGRGLGVGDNQFPTFDAESKSSKIPEVPL